MKERHNFTFLLFFLERNTYGMPSTSSVNSDFLEIKPGGRGDYKQMLSTWQKSVLSFPVVAEVLMNAGKQVLTAVLTVGSKISTTLAKNGETVDALRDQVETLQREVSQLRVQKANHQFKSALAGTLSASPSSSSLLGKRRGEDDGPVSCKRLAHEGRRLLQSIRELSVHEGAPGSESLKYTCVQDVLNTTVLPAPKLSLLLPSCCPIDLAEHNAAINATFLDVGSSSSRRVVVNTSATSLQAAAVDEEMIRDGSDALSEKKRRRRVSFGRDDVREVENYIAEEAEAAAGLSSCDDEHAAEMVPFKQVDLGLMDMGEAGGVDTEEFAAGVGTEETERDERDERTAEPVLLNAAEARKLPFGIQDLLGASLRPAQKRRFSLDRMAAKLHLPVAKPGSHKPLSFNAADIMQVKLRPVQQSAHSAKPQGAQQLGLHDSFKAALHAKFSRTMPATPRTPGDESDVEWL